MVECGTWQEKEKRNKTVSVTIKKTTNNNKQKNTKEYSSIKCTHTETKIKMI